MRKWCTWGPLYESQSPPADRDIGSALHRIRVGLLEVGVDPIREKRQSMVYISWWYVLPVLYQILEDQARIRYYYIEIRGV